MQSISNQDGGQEASGNSQDDDVGDDETASKQAPSASRLPGQGHCTPGRSNSPSSHVGATVPTVHSRAIRQLHFYVTMRRMLTVLDEIVSRKQAPVTASSGGCPREARPVCPGQKLTCDFVMNPQHAQTPDCTNTEPPVLLRHVESGPKSDYHPRRVRRHRSSSRAQPYEALTKPPRSICHSSFGKGTPSSLHPKKQDHP